MVQEESSDKIDRLEISLHKSNCGEDILDFGKAFEIKEPYFTPNDQSEPTLHVNHPSDIIVWPNDLHTEAKHASDLENSTAFATKSANEFKEQGNAALKQYDLLLARSEYSQGLQ
jgi:hypothetical protein